MRFTHTKRILGDHGGDVPRSHRRRPPARGTARRGGNAHRVIVLGPPRGGVVVAAEVARILELPLDILMVRKLGVPMQPELAMGAIGEGGVRIVDQAVLRATGLHQRHLDAVSRREEAVLAARRRAFVATGRRATSRAATRSSSTTASLTGSTACAACEVAAAAGAARGRARAPVALAGSVRALAAVADAVIVCATPSPFGAIGPFYDDFAQTPDDLVVELLEAARNG